MNTSRIAELLASYIVGLELPSGIYDQLSVYLDLLLRWNAKTNLTAIRDPEQIVTRHFGESLFAAGVLFGHEPSILAVSSRAERTGVEGPAPSDDRQPTTDNAGPISGDPLIPAVEMSGMRQARPSEMTLADLGSGAGFPGIPIKLAFPELRVTLIESQNKKATFLKEVLRALGLHDVEVYNGRAEQWGRQADVVTLRAVEKFEQVLPVAAGLLAPGGCLCLLTGRTQQTLLAGVHGFSFEVVKSIPESAGLSVAVGKRAASS